MKKSMKKFIGILCTVIVLIAILILVIYTKKKEEAMAHVTQLREELFYAEYYYMRCHEGVIIIVLEDMMVDMKKNPFKYIETEIIFQEEATEEAPNEDTIVIFPTDETKYALKGLNDYLEEHPMYGYGGQGEDAKKIELAELLNKDNVKKFRDMGHQMYVEDSNYWESFFVGGAGWAVSDAINIIKRQLEYASYFYMDSNRGEINVVAKDIIQGIDENLADIYLNMEIIFQEEEMRDTSNENLIVIFPSERTERILADMNAYLAENPIGGYGGQGPDAVKMEMEDLLFDNGSRLWHSVAVAQAIDDEYVSDYGENDYGPNIRRVLKNLKEDIEYAAYYDMESNRGYLQDRGEPKAWGETNTIAEDIIYDMEKNPFSYVNTEIVFQDKESQDIPGEDNILIWPSEGTAEIFERLNTYLETHPMHGYGGEGTETKKVEMADLVNRDNIIPVLFKIAQQLEEENPSVYEDIF